MIVDNVSKNCTPSINAIIGILFWIEKTKRSEWRTVFRDDIKKIIGLDYGNVLLYEDMSELIETNQNRKKYKCESFYIYKDSEYIFYGKNTVYKIVLEKIVV